MKLNCTLSVKTFTDKDGNERSYNCLVFELGDGSTLDVAIKGDKAKLLKLSNSLKTDKDFWEDR